MKKTAVILILALVISAVLPALNAAAAPAMADLAPYDLAASLIAQDETHPYGSAKLTFKIDGMPRATANSSYYVAIEKKIGDAGWIEVDEPSSDTMLDSYEVSPGTFEFESIWNEDYDWDGTTVVSYRVCVQVYDATFTLAGSSPWSDIATIGVQASSWALAEVEKALGYGLVPESLKNADLTAPITREEFCELALKLYESISEEPIPDIANPFTDTGNPEIIKAFALGITAGMTATEFEPDRLINREQCATMLYRAIHAIAPDADYGTTGVPDFPDQDRISSWASEATKYMFKVGIILGDENGCFMPNALTDAEIAIGYGTATRQQAILMTVRTYEALGDAP